MSRRWVHGLVMFSLAAILCFASCRKTGSPQKVTFVVVGQTALTSMPITLAERLGYFREENLDVSIVDAQGPSRVIEALAGHSADVGVTILDNIFLAASEGKQFRAFVLMSQCPGLALVASPKVADRVHDLNDLGGRSIGVPTLGSSSETLIRYLWYRKGIPQSTPDYVAIGSPRARIAALERGEVDAAVISEPGIALLSAKYGPQLHVLADMRTPQSTQLTMGASIYPGSSVFASQEWLEKNPETAKKVARAIVRAEQYIHAHSAQDIAQQLPADFLAPNPDAYVAGLNSSIPMFSSDGRFDSNVSTVVIDVLSVVYEGMRAKNAQLNGLVTNEYLP